LRDGRVGKAVEAGAHADRHAIGITASMSGGIRVSFGTMTKPLHVGRARNSTA
jgi:hypothetical protein